ncbi:DNA polymerase delta subunit 3-like isoform X2 [Ceratina calcarata]|uniref:DNA polymerase delta subunit 3 n=1 Tax=Ceratina calcarata TaxID=156304 RepID=A0AAJ7JFR9_9HYME|nr:DNA polymerase delta subunit 3-like isoform X2 [Ceratina calcarata]XP_017892415.1 DNA polymerase delta subunit 3-like isoform X2 [Ceratina calcarata]
MMIDRLNEYLETVGGYVFDNDKIVTYCWLSKELEVHVNVAKQILWEFWQKYKDDKDFDCTVLLIGISEDDGMHVQVVRQKDLDAAKKKYRQVISEHVYSIQKVLPDIQLLGLTDKGDVKYSAIKCIENNVRTDEEVHKLCWGAAANQIQPVSREKVQECDKEKVASPEEKKQDKKKGADKKGFNNLFGKTVNKQKNPPAASSADKMEIESSNQTKETSKNTAKVSKKAPQKGGLSSFLQQGKSQANEDSTQKSKTADFSENNKATNSFEKNHITSPRKEEKIPEETVKNTNKPKNVRGRKRNRSKEVNSTAKRRKRIAIQSDSSESGSDQEEEKEDELPPSPERVSPPKERSPSPPKHKVEFGKRKVLKLVDKTFEEDGFLVTKKVHVYESCSEEEPEPEPEVKLKSKADSKTKKNTKQTSLMNFFKKS